ncbi:MAG: 5-(carboxyamino)imidazole ribonucleotide synthase [Xanthomonadales bacterium]|nr:5-(carboxyamino)imidazole ribonucleotide synthase [Xanthomonadales bacterium]
MRSHAQLGVIGGGQLARMMALAARPLGVDVEVYDPSADACAGHVAALSCGAFDDVVALASFAADRDVITFDFENVPAASVEALARDRAVHPGAVALATAQDRLHEKRSFNALGISTAAFADIASRAELDAAVAQLGLPAILKTRRLGYDGKGQFRFRRPEDAEAAWSALGDQASLSGLILEAFVPFQRELSVIAVRGRNGSFASWPLVQNWHVDGVLSASLAPAKVSAAVQQQALDYAQRLAASLDYVGVFALELFDSGDRLLANEMAPRVHNSGHWTIEGAETSQFENHVRAVLGLPLGDTRAVGHACMLNFLGDLPDAAAALAVPGVHWHDYGKAPRAGRKTGHVTVRADDIDGLIVALEALGRALHREAQVAPVIEQLRGR